MGKASFCFAVNFFILATAGALLLTWTYWWMVTVGASMPARRPFFKPTAEVPELIRKASEFAHGPIFAYSLTGGWPTSNSVIRLVTSFLAVGCAFSFAAIVTLVTRQVARRIFTTTLFVLAFLAAGTTVFDAVAIGRVAVECSRQKCVTAVPDVVLRSGNVCVCGVEGWFFITLAADIVLVCCSLFCALLIAIPKFAVSVMSHPVDDGVDRPVDNSDHHD